MRLLVIGGTRFVGRHIVEAALTAGHDVTVFHRGRTGSDHLPGATHLIGDRDQPAGLDLLAASGRWDAVVDACAYVPRQVRQLADALGGDSSDRVSRYLLVSTTSVYADGRLAGHDESAALATLADPTTEEVTEETYGGLKVACERVAADRWGPRLTVVRPTYVVGPHDYTHRFTYWVERVAAGGEVLAPEPRSLPIQVIDARDQAAWVVQLLERDVAGTFHAVSPDPVFTFEAMLELLVGAVGPEGTTLTWVDGSFLLDQGVSEPQLPLWPGPEIAGAEQFATPARAAAAGLAPRPLGVTARELLAAEQASPSPNLYDPGLSREREAELLAAWHAAG